ncbi:MAG TPA: glycosyltransferase [Chthoniobacter sp.]|nr:glycosyltransferase [Chthoniobacter sp.]
MSPTIRFYLPGPIPADMPQSPDVYWAGFRGYMRGGVYAWTVQTFQRLRDAGLNVELSDQLPTEGILVAHRKSVPRDFVPPTGVLFVCLRADATFHPFAHWHVILNELARNSWYPSVYMPHWPQPGLIPRDPARGDRWENAAFFGDDACIASEIRGGEWESILRELKLNWNHVPPEKWHDFSEVDVVVAIRDFVGKHRYANKPPTKLFNAWHAGVPAILGRESAYELQRRGELDYLEARTVPDLVAALRRLRDEPELRRAMVANGRERAKETDYAAITQRWQAFFEHMVVPDYERLRNAGAWQKRWHHWNGVLKTKTQDLQERFWH